MKKILLAVSVFCGLGVLAADLVIQSLDSSGQIVFNEVPDAAAYHVEQAPSLGGPWEPLPDISPSGTGAITSSVPVTASTKFFKVVAELNAVPDGMVKIPKKTISIQIEAFYMDATEVTKAQWDTVYNWAITHGYSFDNVGSGKALNHPVHSVNWYDCAKWCNARSEKDGRTPFYTINGSIYKQGQSVPTPGYGSSNGYHLPWHGEWEHAAHGGSNTSYPWGSTVNHSNANYKANGSAYSYDTSPYTSDTFHPDYDYGSHPYTSPAESFSPNDYGLYNMVGNVKEWGPSSGLFLGQAITSGSDYSDDAWDLRIGYNLWGLMKLEEAHNNIGFRTVYR